MRGCETWSKRWDQRGLQCRRRGRFEAWQGRTKVGTPVGPNVGECDGAIVDIEDGCWVDAVGLSDGNAEGARVGNDVGFNVGEWDGSKVGSAVGLRLGMLVGSASSQCVAPRLDSTS